MLTGDLISKSAYHQPCSELQGMVAVTQALEPATSGFPSRVLLSAV